MSEQKYGKQLMY